ncbi:MAG: outer membrane protein assembly factor BamD [Raineya sp.]|nr:outer membrane protein assembly factor BamD [Raineya sp.]
MKKLLICLCIVAGTLGACSKFNKIRKSKDPLEKYQAAVEYFEQKSYLKALALLEEVEPLLRGKKEYEKAQYLMAHAYFKNKEYEMASYTFKRLYETYPRSEWAEECLYMHAISLYNQSPESELDQKPTLEAIQSIQKYLNAYPQSPKIEEANKIIEELRAKLEKKAYDQALLYYKNSNYKAAIKAMTNFQKDFPDSAYMEEILYKRIESAYNLARESIFSKQKERLQETITLCEEYKDKFPQSKYLKAIEYVSASAIRQIAELNKVDNTQQN